MNELRACRGRPGGKVALLGEEDAEPAAGSVSSNATAVDAAANHGQIERRGVCHSLATAQGASKGAPKKRNRDYSARGKSTP